jgi:uncharacterized membrane protein YpjA
MKDFCTVIGEVLATALLFAVPILCTCSIALGWDADVILGLIILTMFDFGFWFGCVNMFVNEY